MSKTTVVNCKQERYDFLIDRTTVFGNPFRIGRNWDRAEVIRRFREYFNRRIASDAVWRSKVVMLMGGRLGCHCKPLDCHGDVYAEWLNEYQEWLEKVKLDD